MIMFYFCVLDLETNPSTNENKSYYMYDFNSCMNLESKFW